MWLKRGHHTVNQMIKTRNFCLRHTYAEVDGFVSNSQKGWSPSRLTPPTVEIKGLIFFYLHFCLFFSRHTSYTLRKVLTLVMLLMQVAARMKQSGD